MAFDEQLRARIRVVLAGRNDIAERRMFGGLAFLRDGRMCCGIVGRDLMVRVVDAEIESALRQPHVRPMDFTGRPLRGFVYVAPPAIAEDDQLRAWVTKGLLFTEREPPPPKPDADSAARPERRIMRHGSSRVSNRRRLARR